MLSTAQATMQVSPKLVRLWSQCWLYGSHALTLCSNREVVYCWSWENE